MMVLGDPVTVGGGGKESQILLFTASNFIVASKTQTVSKDFFTETNIKKFSEFDNFFSVIKIPIISTGQYDYQIQCIKDCIIDINLGSYRTTSTLTYKFYMMIDNIFYQLGSYKQPNMAVTDILLKANSKIYCTTFETSSYSGPTDQTLVGIISVYKKTKGEIL